MIEKCQQRFPMHQTDIYYIKRYLHAATPRLSDRPSEREMRDIGLKGNGGQKKVSTFFLNSKRIT